jgi:hypothetical protein
LERTGKIGLLCNRRYWQLLNRNVRLNQYPFTKLNFVVPTLERGKDEKTA